MVEASVVSRGRGRGADQGVGNLGPPPVPAIEVPRAPQEMYVMDPYPERSVKTTDIGKSVKVAQLEAQLRSQNAELARLRAILLSALAAKRDGGPKHEECLFEVEVSLAETVVPQIPVVVPADVAPSKDDFQTLFGSKSHVFIGREGALICKEWIRIMEQTFGFGKFTKTQKVNYAVRRLGGSALLWWDTVELSLPANDRKGMTWDEFVKRIDRRFDNHGGKQHADLAETGGCGDGYKEYQGPCSKNDVSCRRCGMSDHSVKDCIGIEDDNLKEKQVAVGEKREWDGPTGSSPKQKIKYGNRAGIRKGRNGGCAACHKVHPGPCNKADINCHKCGKNGHFARDCPVVGIICYNCQEVGHTSTQCPKAKKNAR